MPLNILVPDALSVLAVMILQIAKFRNTHHCRRQECPDHKLHVIRDVEVAIVAAELKIEVSPPAPHMVRRGHKPADRLRIYVRRLSDI